MNWNPVEDTMEVWNPRGGWNPSWSEQEKITAVHLFFFFRRKKYPAPQAEVLAQMAIWKRKFPSLHYTTEQENILTRAMCPIIHSEAT